jgi:hypothetical protein
MKRSCRHCALAWPLRFFFIVGRRMDGSILRRPECKFCRCDRVFELRHGAARRRTWSMRGVRREFIQTAIGSLRGGA